MTLKKEFDCLLLKTKDKRQFFTSQKNLSSLIEFKNFFHAEIRHVKIKKGEVLNLEELASAISNPEYSANFEYEDQSERMLEVGSDPKLLGQKGVSRKEKIRRAGIIRNHIKKEFENGKTVVLSKLKSRYKRYELSSACFSSHISYVKKEMEKQGCKIKKIGGGKYVKI